MRISIFLFFTLMSCTERNNNKYLSDSIINYDVNNIVSRQNISSLIDIIDVVVLDEEKPIAAIEDIQFYDNKIYIHSQNPIRLSVYSNDGIFDKKIGAVGDAPGMYSEINDFVIKGDQVIVLDRSLQRLIFYNLSDGSFEKTMTMSMFSQSFDKLEDGFIFYNGNEISESTQKSIVFTDDKLNILKQEIPINEENKKYLNFFDLNNFSHDDNKVFHYSFNDTLYSYESGTLEPKYTIDLGPNSIKKDDFDRTYNNSYEFITALRKENKSFRLIGLVEGDMDISFLYESEGFKWAIINKQNNFGVSIPAISNDLFGNGEIIESDMFFDLWPLIRHKDQFLFFLSSDMITSESFRLTHGLAENQDCLLFFKFKEVFNQ